MEFGYSGSVYSKSLAKFLRNLGINQEHVFTEYSLETTKTVDMLLGIKYLSIFNKKECIKNYEHLDNYENDYFDIYKNPYSLSLGYAVDNKILDLDYEENNDTFFVQNNILRSLTGINEDVYIEHSGDVIKEIQDVELKENNYVETGDNPKLIYEFEVQSENNIYVYMVARESKKVRVFVNDEEIGTYFTSYNNEMINLGKREIGEKIKLEVCLEAEEILIESIHIGYENEEALLKHYNKLKEEQIDFKKKDSRTFIGKINIEESEKNVMLTIPYEEGWKITIDGEETEYREVLDALTLIKLKKGEHQIVLKYTPPEINIGIILSISGIIIFLIGINLKKFKRKK